VDAGLLEADPVAARDHLLPGQRQAHQLVGQVLTDRNHELVLRKEAALLGRGDQAVQLVDLALENGPAFEEALGCVTIATDEAAQQQRDGDPAACRTRRNVGPDHGARRPSHT
jgi:hypothetical protein